MQTLFRKWKVSFRMKKSQCGSCLQKKKKKNDNKNKKERAKEISFYFFGS